MSARRTARHGARLRYRGGWRLLWAAPFAAALVAGGLYLSRPGPAAPASGAHDAALTAGSCRSAATPAAGCARPSPTATSPVTAGDQAARHRAATRRPTSHRPHATTAGRDRTPAASKPPPSSAPASPAPTSPSATTRAPAKSGEYGQAVAQVLALINQARAAAGLAPYTVTAGLVRSASGHTQVMASGCGLSHQCPGEPPLGTRETDAGVHWTAVGENIGEAGPVSATSAAIAAAVVGLTEDMLNEKPPDDGHRLNILSAAFRHVGIAVYLDSSGTVWMTQDFSN
jgi:uncharacterized protein YkwD